MSLPTVVIVGRPNVGKSSLFNRLCKNRRAITSPVPGTTRDWLEGTAHWGSRSFRLIDTGGYTPEEGDIPSSVRRTVEERVRDADAVLWVVDGQEGLVPADERLGRWLRRLGNRVLLVVNKVDDAAHESRAGEFFRLGFGDPLSVSASHGRNTTELLDRLEKMFPGEEKPASAEGIPIALVGRPNVGKSSLLNSVLGTERAIVSPVPGTTRDTVDTLFEWNSRRFLLIDTAGLRASKSKASYGLEGLTRLMAEKALDRCEVAVLVLDAADGIRDGDIAVARLIQEKRRACVVCVNKWDLVTEKFRSAAWYRSRFPEDVPFLSDCPLVFVSAKTGQRVEDLLEEVANAHGQFHREFDNESLRAFLWKSVQERPYTREGRKLVFKDAEQTATAPPAITVRCNMTSKDVHFSYVRHLENVFRKNYHVAGTPLIFRFRRG
jgi:GTPase